jgi:hypothetical protein
MKKKLEGFGLEYISGFLFSLLTYFPISIIFAVLIGMDNIGMVVTALFSAYLLGSIVGFLLIDRFIFKVKGSNIFAIGFSIVAGLAGGYLGLVMLDNFQNIPILLVQMIITGLVLVGYNISSLFNLRSAIRFE